MVPTLRHLITSLRLGYVDLMTTRAGDDRKSVVEERRQQAAEAEQLLERDGEVAADLARDLIDAEQPVDDVVAATSHRVLAVVALRRGDAGAAATHIDASVAAAERSSVPVLLGKALMTATAVAASTGDPEGALAFADRAEPLLSDELRVRLAIQRGSVLVAGFSAVDEAIAVFDRVLLDFPLIAGFELGILRLNRGTQLLRRGDLRTAAVDFTCAAQEFRAVDNRQYETAAMLHGAMAASRMGDLPTVFTIHRELAEVDALSRSDPHDLLDLAESLVIAGLLAEAAELTERAIELGRRSGVTELSVQVELIAARVLRLLGDPRARGAVDRALASAEDLGSSSLRALVVLESAALADRDQDANADTTELRHAATVLHHAGHRRAALEAEIGILQREFGRAETEVCNSADEGELPEVSSSLTPFDRAQLRHLRGLRLSQRGDPARARRELLTGIRDIERARAAIAATDVRAAAGDRAPQMAALGLRLAIDAGRPRPVLEWAERVRATALRLANPSRIHGSDVRDQLDELRRLDAVDPGRVAALERQITRDLRTGREAGRLVRASNASEICDRLGPDRTLLEYVEVEGQLWLCRVERQRVSLIDLAVAVADVKEAVGKLLFGLRRMATRVGPPADAARAMVAQVAGRLGRLILPAHLHSGDVVVIVPTGPLHHLPWAILPALAEQAFVLAPSAHVWCTAVDRPRRGDGLVAATGPRLVEAADEAHQVSAIWADPSPPLIGASSSDLRTHLPGSRVAHLCCHGQFRTDSPQFSALELRDGPFTVFDLEGLAELPRLVVLSACNLGSVDVRLGDDLLGFPAALFGRGVSSLIASVLPVEDAATRTMMVRLHEGLAAGVSPAVAVRDSRVAVSGLGSNHAAAAASFQCFGAG
jgi:tetratricopeptide (TPR) repeat protein